MQIDTEHLQHWMQAIRQSPDPIRTLDAFWSGQLKSREWLIENLRPYININDKVDICGGWVGVLASMLFQSGLPVDSIRSIDIDPSCAPIARLMNRSEAIAGRFTAVTGDMCFVSSDADVNINTSCEHVTQPEYEAWLSNIPDSKLLVLQSNNYAIDEHIRTSSSLEDFAEQSKIDISWSGQLALPRYTRYMLIGKKHV